MLRIMRFALSLVVPLSAVLSANPFTGPAHGGPPAQTPTAAEPTSPKAVVHLFNGKDLAGWKADVPARDTDPNGPPSFIVRNGMLVSLGKPEGHLLTDAATATTGWRSSTASPARAATAACSSTPRRPRALYKMFPQSIEVQMMSGNAGDFWVIQEDIEVKDMETRRPRKEGEKWGGTEGDARRILNLTDGSEKPLGEWNTHGRSRRAAGPSRSG